MCAELAELGMQLARAAAARTLADWTEPDADPQEQSAPEPPAASSRAPPPPRRTTEPGLLFSRLARAVRDCIALEARIAAGPGHAHRGATRHFPPDPRRRRLRDLFDRITEQHADRAEIRRDIADRLEEELAAGPQADLGTIFSTICEDLDLELDLAHLPDEVLRLLAAPPDHPIEDPDPNPFTWPPKPGGPDPP